MVQNKTFNNVYFPNETSGYDVYDCPPELKGSVYRATRADLFFNAQGASDIAVTIVLNIFLYIAAFLEAKTIQKIDANLQSTKDYAVVLVNPPSDVTDPEL